MIFVPYITLKNQIIYPNMLFSIYQFFSFSYNFAAKNNSDLLHKEIDLLYHHWVFGIHRIDFIHEIRLGRYSFMLYFGTNIPPYRFLRFFLNIVVMHL